MSRKCYTPEQIIGNLREAEVALAQRETTGQVCRTLGIAEQFFYRWRREYNTVRPHSALGYQPPAPEAIAVTPRDSIFAMLRQDLGAD
jgi:putative transposase